MKLLSLIGLLAVPALLDNLAHIRVKQENEEANSVVRIIQQAAIVAEQNCLPVQQARQRIKDLNASQKGRGNVTVEAGHGTLNINGNQGEIDNSVHVQVINENEPRNCI